MNDLELVNEFTRNHSQEAFAEIVKRHLDLIYCAALRLVRSPQLAEEVAQSVFTDLSRSAARLKPDTILTAWLYEVTRRTSINMVRGEARRQNREQIALELNAMNAPDDNWRQIEPILEEAMHSLDQLDRAAILLRYFQNKSLGEVGQSLGTTDDTARKRVNSALEQLRAFFAKRGLSIGTTGLAAIISANAVQAAPVGLFLATSTAAVGTTMLATKVIAMTVTQKILVTAAFATVVGTGLYEGHQVSRERAVVNTLQQQQIALNAQIKDLTRERDEATRRLAASPKGEGLTPELLRLRGEVGRLTTTAKDPTQSAARTWMQRVDELKQYLEQNPEGKIPELQFVAEDDWLRVTMNAFGTNQTSLSEENYRLALVSLRNMAKGKFARLASAALRSYALTHDRQFPTNITELEPHFAERIDPAILQRYGIFPTATFQDTRATGESVIAEISSPDEDINYRTVIFGEGADSIPFRQPLSVEMKAQLEAQIKPLIETLLPVASAYAAAHEGRPPPDPAQMISYATTLEQQAALQKLIAIRKEAASGVSATRPLTEPRGPRQR